VGSLKDSQREVVQEQSKPVELGSDGHGSADTEEVVNLLPVKAKEDGERLTEDGDGEEEGVSTTEKGTIVATTVLVGFVAAFGALGFVYKDEINELLTQFSDFLEGGCLFFPCSLKDFTSCNFCIEGTPLASGVIVSGMREFCFLV